MTNQPELKACELLPCPFCLRAGVDASYDFTDKIRYYLIECSGCGASCACQASWDRAVKQWNARPSPIIPEDAYPKPIDEKTVPEEFDELIADDALQEAVRSLRDANGYATIADYGADIETLLSHAMKGESK